MGYIEETGAAQHYRDARILPIYEGTTAIQANDLVFRKTLRDQGEAVRALFAEMRRDMQAIDNEMSAAMCEAITIAQNTLDSLLAKANMPRQAAVGGVNWLMLLGYLCGGWLMVRAADHADTGAETFSPEFRAAKSVTAQIYITHCLPHVGRLATTIMAEDDPVLAMQPEWLSRH
jgi:dienelactone hydrolase